MTGAQRPAPSRALAAAGEQDAETAAYMARRAACRRCGDSLVPSPTAIGLWITDRQGIGRGLCPDGSMHDAQRTDGRETPAAGEDAAAAAAEGRNGE